MDDVEFFRGLNFKWNKIADILGVSRSTLYTHLSEEGIPEELQYSSITDRELRAYYYNGWSSDKHPRNSARYLPPFCTDGQNGRAQTALLQPEVAAPFAGASAQPATYTACPRYAIFNRKLIFD